MWKEPLQVTVKCSKISNTRCQPKKLKQTVQTDQTASEEAV